ncbi:hypothetical protein CN884_09200 [Ochrobactrum sp. 30A/1000/2015]|nr:hypothetical protein A7J42_16455 [Brucella intermedia]PJT25058.1 hypothetical protein CN884_09200 [Ochrobactrum sp. 30A/1000/2015]PJT40508.1 hypothetical protein CN883_03185 [Ochrobactrum sp. 27A/999/2015]PJT42855.1 hypothetical protein CN882_12865 [Ochrobactrum sp. 23A/997/2015]
MIAKHRRPLVFAHKLPCATPVEIDLVIMRDNMIECCRRIYIIIAARPSNIVEPADFSPLPEPPRWAREAEVSWLSSNFAVALILFRRGIEGNGVDIVLIAIPHGPPEEIRTGSSCFECAVDVYFIDLVHRNRTDSLRPRSGRLIHGFRSNLVPAVLPTQHLLQNVDTGSASRSRQDVEVTSFFLLQGCAQYEA